MNPQSRRPSWPIRMGREPVPAKRARIRNGENRRAAAAKSIYWVVLGRSMPLYVTLYKFTDQGRKTVKESPKRMRDVISTLEKMPGVKVHQALYTSGRYDIVVVTEAPNEEVANTVALTVMTGGNVVGETLHAFTIADIEKVVSKVP